MAVLLAGNASVNCVGKQLEEWKATQPSQSALFVLKNDCRAAAERTAAGRYQQPSLFSFDRFATAPYCRP
jgi:hypothetical protein